MADYEAMTVEQLTSEVRRLEALREDIKRNQKAIIAIRDRKSGENAAKAKVAWMSDSEKEALRQALGVQGVSAPAVIGTPGPEKKGLIKRLFGR